MGDAVIFNGDFIKALKAQFNLFDSAYVLTGTADPTAVAQDAPKGSLYLRQTAAGDGAAYVKKDNGSSTNWDLVQTTTGPVLTADRAVVTDAFGSLTTATTTATEIGYVNGVTSAIQTQLNGKVDEVASTDHAVVRFDGAGGAVQNSGAILDDSNNISGLGSISGTSATLSGLTASRALQTDGSKNLQSSTVTTTELGYLAGVTAPTGSGALVLANTPTLITPVLGAATGTSLQLSGLTADRALVTDGSKNLASATTTATEISYVNGVTSAIQTQLDAKSATITGAASTVVTSNLTADQVVISNGSGKIASEAALSPVRGGTGVANNAAATLTRSGNHALTFTTTATTSLLLPTSGTVSTQEANINTADTNTTLTISDNPKQVFTSFTAARTITLPTTSVPAGYQIELSNTADQIMTVNASGGSALTIANSCNNDATIMNGVVIVRALQATPTTPAHWRVIYVYEEGTFAANFNQSAGASGSNTEKTIDYTRCNKIVSLFAETILITTGTATPIIATAAATMPTRLQPAATSESLCAIISSGTLAGDVAKFHVNSDGSINIYRTLLGSTNWATAANCGMQSYPLTYTIS